MTIPKNLIILVPIGTRVRYVESPHLTSDRSLIAFDADQFTAPRPRRSTDTPVLDMPVFEAPVFDAESVSTDGEEMRRSVRLRRLGDDLYMHLDAHYGTGSPCPEDVQAVLDAWKEATKP